MFHKKIIDIPFLHVLRSIFRRPVRDEEKLLPEMKKKVQLIQKEIQQLRLDIKN
jgi:hypothetical protein